ncbi:unnamed protein product [Ixodes pacificus]
MNESTLMIFVLMTMQNRVTILLADSLPPQTASPQRIFFFCCTSGSLTGCFKNKFPQLGITSFPHEMQQVLVYRDGRCLETQNARKNGPDIDTSNVAVLLITPNNTPL